MCGIYGKFWTVGQACPNTLKSDAAQKMDLITYRGPDDSGMEVTERGVLCHLRLSIIDESTYSRQPMSDGQDALLSYNGEVYNFAELRSELEHLGHDFSSTGDTEVVLKSVLEWGVEEACRRFDGMFSFAFVDQKRQLVVLARDLVGIKPLFYRATDRTIEFGSELKLFGRPNPNTSTLMAMLLGAPTLCPKSPWEDVLEVRPGECIEFSLQSGDLRKINWQELANLLSADLYREIEKNSEQEYLERFNSAFTFALKRTSISDVPVGVGVSGGIDSSIVSAVGRSVMNRNIPLFHADVVGFESERRFAAQLAQEIHCPLTCASVSPEDFTKSLAEATWANDFPVGYHGNSVPFLAMARAAREQIKVILTGEGADELNCGYGWPRSNIVRRTNLQRVDKIIRIIGRLRLNRIAGWIKSFSIDFASADDRVGRLGALCNGARDKQVTEQFQNAYAFLDGLEREEQLEYFKLCFGHLQSLLWRNDRMGMYASVESRFPFLQSDLLKLQLNTPLRFKRSHKQNKLGIRYTGVRAGISNQLAYRPKFGFTLNPSTHSRVQNSLFTDGFLVRHFPGIIHDQTNRDWDAFRFYLVSTEVWGRLFCLGHSIDEVSAAMFAARV